MRILLIPSATLVPVEMRSKLGSIPVSLFPLQSVVMLERIYNWYRNDVDKVYIIADQGKKKIYEYIKLKGLPISVIELNELKDLGYTVWFGMNEIYRQYGEDGKVYINFGDTLLSNKPDQSLDDIVYYSWECVSKDWTHFKFYDGIISEITDKGHRMQCGDSYGNVFTGVFEIAHPCDLMDELETALSSPEKDIDSFYQALKKYSEIHPFLFVHAEDWIDVGHQERYIQAKKVVAARSFNTIEIDGDRGVLTKRSENKDKLIDEIKWYLRLPDQLQYQLPRIYQYSLDWSNPYVTMEYYGYTTLHEMLVYGNVDEAQWRKIFSKLKFILDDMRRFRMEDSIENIKQALEDVYLNKTISRLQSLRNDGHFSLFFKKEIIVNKKVYPSLEKCIYLLRRFVYDELLEALPQLCIIHGDLCFSNILVENDLGFLRVIDPRGSFGKYDIYGDPRYDIAKLMHSLDGQYDWIIEDMFSIEVSENNIDFKLPQGATAANNAFADTFSELLINKKKLKLIESSLFFSMISLHNEKPNRQYAMLAVGLRLLDEAIGDDM